MSGGRPGTALDDPARRDAYVTGIFDLIAPRYDRFTRWFSYGMDAAWKRELRRLIAEALCGRDHASTPVVLDLATGTGDLGIAALELEPGATVVGVDVSLPMLTRASARAVDGRRVRCVAGDMTRLPIADGAADLVTAGYGLRNAPDCGAALDEIVRALAPGGALVTLDFFLPAGRLWRELFLGYLAVAGWIYGALWHGRPDAYVYIPRSIRRFVTAPAYERALAARGLQVLHSRRHLLGAVMIHLARKGH